MKSQEIYPIIDRIISTGHFPEHDKAIKALETAEAENEKLKKQIDDIYKYNLSQIPLN